MTKPADFLPSPLFPQLGETTRDDMNVERNDITEGDVPKGLALLTSFLIKVFDRKQTELDLRRRKDFSRRKWNHTRPVEAFTRSRKSCSKIVFWNKWKTRLWQLWIESLWNLVVFAGVEEEKYTVSWGLESFHKALWKKYAARGSKIHFLQVTWFEFT